MKYSLSKTYHSINIGGKIASVNFVAELECEDTEEAKAAAHASIERWMDNIAMPPAQPEEAAAPVKAA